MFLTWLVLGFGLGLGCGLGLGLGLGLRLGLGNPRSHANAAIYEKVYRKFLERNITCMNAMSYHNSYMSKD